MKKFKYIAASVVATMALGGCGGSDSSSSNDTAQTGTFVDAPVAGLSYQTPSISGQTDSNGQFKYKAGEKVTFKLGDIEIGSVDGSTIVTPKNFGNDTVAANLAYILQNLDTDGDPTDDVIKLPSAETIKTYFSTSGVAALNLEDNATVTNLVSGLKAHVETQLHVDLPDVNVTEALNNMENYIAKHIEKKFTPDFYAPGKEYYIVMETDPGIQHLKFGENGMVMDRLGDESEDEFANPSDRFTVSSDKKTLTWRVTDDDEAEEKGMLPYDVKFTILELTDSYIKLQAVSKPYGTESLYVFKDLNEAKEYAVSK